MLNEDLISPHEVEIAKLKKIISDFKKYDEERKKYYKESMIKLGELQSYIEELENNTIIPKLKDKIQNQAKELNSLQNKLYIYESIKNNKIKIENINNTYKYINALNLLDIRNKEVKNLRNTVKDLICKLNKK